ncbi:hypothetical protein BGZ57DRAFT_859347 [Hyaloscypha finlandica]|nr:hypothetical protein BGZ57DRAFT_859347 [Hyaloscypha finlandica]
MPLSWCSGGGALHRRARRCARRVVAVAVTCRRSGFPLDTRTVTGTQGLVGIVIVESKLLMMSLQLVGPSSAQPSSSSKQLRGGGTCCHYWQKGADSLRYYTGTSNRTGLFLGRTQSSFEMKEGFGFVHRQLPTVEGGRGTTKSWSREKMARFLAVAHQGKIWPHFERAARSMSGNGNFPARIPARLIRGGISLYSDVNLLLRHTRD